MSELPYIDIRERLESSEESARAGFDSFKAGIWTSLVCIVQTFDPVAVTITAQPAIRGIVLGMDGARAAVNMPLLVDIPVMFQNGGGAYHTYPIQPGDEALVFFAARDCDSWWQSGGVQDPMSARKCDLSDGFAIIGPQSKKRAITNISIFESQWRNAAGSAGISFNPETGSVTIIAPGGLFINADISQTGGQIVSKDVVASSISLVHHKHNDAQSGQVSEPIPV